MGNLYVQKHFKEDAKRTMVEMVRDIRKEMEVILGNIDWMDAKTRAKAQDKLRSMKEYIGYPEELLQVHLLEEVYKVSTTRIRMTITLLTMYSLNTLVLWQDLEVSPMAHFQNGIEIGKWSTAYVWSKMREKVGGTKP